MRLKEETTKYKSKFIVHFNLFVRDEVTVCLFVCKYLPTLYPLNTTTPYSCHLPISMLKRKTPDQIV